MRATQNQKPTLQTKGKPNSELFEFQNWEVYQKSLEANKVLFHLAKQLGTQGEAKLSDQLRRASSSILLNLAEGVSRFSLKEKANFWRISKGSLFECIAMIDLTLAVIKEPLNIPKNLKSDMSSIGRMLSGLIRWAEEKQKE